MTTTITVYGKPACVQCRMTENVLDKAGATYTKRDVTADQDAFETVQALGYMQAPVVTIHHGDQIADHWSGFQPAKLADHTTKETRR